MAVQTYTIRNSCDGTYDTFHWDPALFTSTTMREANTENQGTTHGKADPHKDTSRATAESR